MWKMKNLRPCEPDLSRQYAFTKMIRSISPLNAKVKEGDLIPSQIIGLKALISLRSVNLVRNQPDRAIFYNTLPVSR
jgi:hypothetical protein